MVEAGRKFWLRVKSRKVAGFCTGGCWHDLDLVMNVRTVFVTDLFDTRFLHQMLVWPDLLDVQGVSCDTYSQ